MKRIAVAAVTLVALLAVLVAALPYVVPAGFLRDLIAAKMTTWTGRTVTIAGEPHLSIYPDLAITVEDLTVASPEGTAEESFIAAEGVRALVRPLPLLFGRVEFREFELIRPRFRLVVAKDGSTNWRLTESAIAERARQLREHGTDGTAGNGTPDLLSPDIRIGRLRVTEGIVLYDDLASERREEFTGLTLEMDWETASAPVLGRGRMTWRDEPVAFTLSVPDPLQLIAGGASPIRFNLAATTLRIAFAGEARSAGLFTLGGHATVFTPSLRRTIKWMGFPMEVGATLGAGRIEGDVLVSGRTISFEDAAVELDGNRASGDLALVLAGERPALSGSLASERIDLTAYVEAARGGIVAEGPWPIAVAGLPYAGALDAELRVHAEEVIHRRNRIADVNTVVTTFQGAVEVDVLSASLNGGGLTGRVGAGMVGDHLVARADLSLSGVPAGLALSDLFGVEFLDGTAALDLDLQARGSVWGSFVRSIAGTADIAVTQGSIAGIDLVALAEALAVGNEEPIAANGGSSVFSSFGARLTVGDGGVATSDLTLRASGIDLRLTGKGSLVTGAVEAQGRLLAAGQEIPIAVTGRWSAPQFALLPRPATEEAPTVQGSLAIPGSDEPAAGTP